MSCGSPLSAAQRNGPLPRAEERPDVRRHEAGEGEGVGVAGLLGHAADVVAVVEGVGAGLLQRDHGLDVDDDAGDGAAHVLVRVLAPQHERLVERHAVGHVAVEHVVRRRLVGDQVGDDAAADQLRIDVRRVAEQGDGERLAGRHRLVRQLERLVQAVGGDVDVRGLQTPLDAVRVDLDAERDAAGHGDGERLGAAHTAEAGRQHQLAGQVAAVVLLPCGGERLVRALQDALRADVDPRAGGHLPVHGEPERVQAAELVPVGPVADQVGVGDEHARRHLVGLEHAHGLAALHQQRLVVLEAAQRADDRVEALPVASGLAGAAVHDELVRILSDLRIEVVHQHAQRGLLLPAPAADLRAARRADRPGSRLGLCAHDADLASWWVVGKGRRRSRRPPAFSARSLRQPRGSFNPARRLSRKLDAISLRDTGTGWTAGIARVAPAGDM